VEDVFVLHEPLELIRRLRNCRAETWRRLLFLALCIPRRTSLLLLRPLSHELLDVYLFLRLRGRGRAIRYHSPAAPALRISQRSRSLLLLPLFSRLLLLPHDVRLVELFVLGCRSAPLVRGVARQRLRSVLFALIATGHFLCFFDSLVVVDQLYDENVNVVDDDAQR